MTHKGAAEVAFQDVEEDLRALSRWLYENPETAFQEYESSRRLAAYLSDHGFDVTYPAYGLETAFEAHVGSSGPRVVVCCEYDALPAIGHACGHNIIATAALGAGLALAGLVDELGIRVTVLGTPAEEGGGGKVDLLEAGAFEDAAASMMIHPGPNDELDPSFQARHNVEVEYFGKDSHAAFAPWEGVNALDAFVNAYVNVSTLRQAFHPGDRVHCMVNHAGDASNIIASYSKSTWGIRAATWDRLEELTPKVMACFEAAALSTGCRLEAAAIGHSYLNMVNNPVMTALFAENSATFGRRMAAEDEIGASGGSSDMGNVSQVVPAIHPMIGLECGDAVNHQPEFAAHTITPDGDRAMRDGALGMAFTIIDMADQAVWDRL